MVGNTGSNLYRDCCVPRIVFHGLENCNEGEGSGNEVVKLFNFKQGGNALFLFVALWYNFG